jgi:hypothetical protein
VLPRDRITHITQCLAAEEGKTQTSDAAHQ